jgi:predicted metal-dependent peptidase
VTSIDSESSGDSDDSYNAEMARQQADRAMRLVCASLPWLSGLAYAVEIVPDRRVSVAAVTASGRVMINPELFTKITLSDSTFILAHELLHLALDTFSRESVTDDHDTVNRAHDYIINDMLREELGMEPPLGGLNLYGCSQWSLEKMVHWMRDNNAKVPTACWTLKDGIECGPIGGSLSGALRDAGILPKSPPQRPGIPKETDSWHLEHLDVIPLAMEQRLFPGRDGIAEQASSNAAETRSERIRRVAVKSLAVGQLDRLLRQMTSNGGGCGHAPIELTALRDSYMPPWEMALQNWLEASVPGDRSYARPSRRGADRTDCVLPGKTRVGWTIHIVLDTSGSMLCVLPRLLGMIADFSEGVGVSELHLVQCGDELTADDWVPVAEVALVELIGGGGGGLSPGFERLASDPEVQSALIITDTYEEFPTSEPPFNVLWAVVGNRGFEPPYGTAMFIEFD